MCQGKDIFERMNYLYQASHLMVLQNRVAASYYGNIMVGCARKSVFRIEPNLKRSICKSCQSPLIPGETARVRLSSRGEKRIKWTCLMCLNTKKYPARKGYKLWPNQPDSVVETFKYGGGKEGDESNNTSNESEEFVESSDPVKV